MSHCTAIDECQFHDLPFVDMSNGLWELYKWECTDASGNLVGVKTRDLIYYSHYYHYKDDDYKEDYLWNMWKDFDTPVRAGGQCKLKCGDGYQDSLCK